MTVKNFQHAYNHAINQDPMEVSEMTKIKYLEDEVIKELMLPQTLKINALLPILGLNTFIIYYNAEGKSSDKLIY